ncbi:MAG: hypothetical protein A2782_00150 [Candidatus Blackburnbacteria bacterium RIFCSPHIGHO2_01_FULL_43_15b]|uniref:GPI inositol-deacylase PGAP1-like alpha/beta domain-containing protein n=1 Tax=Candidatus Blackburnbacteria bacterium RIFCSPHIGHO2_01_FULL_43_15b TaxID=1797513 RepID=A0A1G1V1M5_9BACT|nr:MAG: hypothetical protein A2782_00150 [Candidatus Blackburnbacteria bacterium RIFCSPHIGHO2_01_FULL_43_15b]
MAFWRAMHVLLLLFLFIRPADTTAQQMRPCLDRTLILLQGINTAYASREETFRDLLPELSGLYSRVVHYSYNLEDPGNYEREHTFQYLSRSVAALANIVKLETLRCPGASIDLIGHSLGGLVALTYVGARERELETARIKHVITLDSPVNGNSQHTLAFMADLFGWDVAESDVGRVLVQIKQEVQRDVNIALAKRLQGKTIVRTLGSRGDWVVPYEDAVIPGFELEFFLPNMMPLGREDVACWEEELRSICAGHDQILRDVSVRNQILFILSWAPPRKVSNEEENRTSSGIAAIILPDGTIHVAWLSYETIWISREPPRQTASRNRWISYARLSPQGVLSSIFNLKDCTFVRPPVLLAQPDKSTVLLLVGDGCAYRVRTGEAPVFIPTFSQGTNVGMFVDSAFFDKAGVLHSLWTLIPTAYGPPKYFTGTNVGRQQPQGWVPSTPTPVRRAHIFQTRDGTIHLALVEGDLGPISRVRYQRSLGAGAWSNSEVILDLSHLGETIDNAGILAGEEGVCVLAQSFGRGRRFGYLQCADERGDWVGSEALPAEFAPSYSDWQSAIRSPDQALHLVGMSQDRTRLRFLSRAPAGGGWSEVMDLPDGAENVFYPIILLGLDGKLHVFYSAGSGDYMDVFHLVQ